MTAPTASTPWRAVQRDAIAFRRACVQCGEPFDVRNGEVQFGEQAGLPLWDRCRWCRPTRRERLAAASPVTRHPNVTRCATDRGWQPRENEP